MVQDTSIKSYAERIRDKANTSQAAKLYRFIKKNAGLTRLQISDKSGVRINAVCGRIRELIDNGLVTHGPKVIDSTGKEAYTIIPVP